MPEPVSPDIDEWISSNTHLLSLLDKLHHDYSGDVTKGKDTFARLLSCITNAPNLQPLGCYHAWRFWDEFLTTNEREDILKSLRDPHNAVQKKGIADLHALFKYYIPVVDPPLPFAVPVWRLSVEWPDEQWRDMAQKMDEDSLYDILPDLSSKIRIPANLTDHYLDPGLISTVFSHSGGQNVSPDVASGICRQLHLIRDGFWSPTSVVNKDDIATSFRSFISSPIFEDREAGTWYCEETTGMDDCPCPLFVYFYPIKHANTRVLKHIFLLNWFVTDTNCFPVIIADTISSSRQFGEYELCHRAIAILYIARTAIAESTSSERPRRVSVMVLYIHHTGVNRYLFSCDSPLHKIQYWYKYYDFRKLQDLGFLWLELWNSRTLLIQQFHGFDLSSWLQRFRNEHKDFSLYPHNTPPSSSVIFSRSRPCSECVDSLDQERRKNRVTWLNSHLRKFKFRVDKFVHANVIRIVHWTTREVVEYAKFLPADSYELSIHRYLLSLSEHPDNRTVPILRVLEDPEGCSVAFTPNVGDRLSPPSTIERMLDIASQICHGVNFMHQHGITHLDLKMENIILSSAGRITIIDFSCAFYIPPPPGLICESVGTPGYTAPEVEEEHPYDPVAADIYSLGWVLRQLCDTWLLVYLEMTKSIHQPLSFLSYLEMTKSMLAEDPLSRPPLSQIISRIQSLIDEPSLWEYLEKNRNTESLI